MPDLPVADRPMPDGPMPDLPVPDRRVSERPVIGSPQPPEVGASDPQPPDPQGLLLAAASRLMASGPGTWPTDPHAWRDASVIEAVGLAWRRGDLAAVRALADGYDSLVLLVPRPGPGAPAMVAAGTGERRRRGAFATPRALATALAAHALPTGLSGPVPRVVDPACGSGALLRAGFIRLCELGVTAREAFEALHGVDDDPAAVAVCRAVLAAQACSAGYDCRPQDLAGRIVVGDALLGGTRTGPRPDDGLVWHEAFAAVLDAGPGPGDPVTGWRGGFEAVLANPPWERLKVIGKDWQGAPPPELRDARASAARAVREGGRHPLTGAGEVNAYLPFAETCWRLLAPEGRGALVVPAGIASDRSAAALLEEWLRTGSLERVHLLDPAEPLFPGVSGRVGIAIVVLGSGPVRRPGAASHGPATVAVGLRTPGEDPGPRQWSLDPAIPRLVNPNTGTLPLFTGERDAAVVTGVHRRVPVLVRRGPRGESLADAWQLRLVTPLHMTRDARWFVSTPGAGLLPLWEAKHAGLLDPHGGARRDHRYWVPRTLMEDRWGDLMERGWLGGYRNVTTADSPRTLVPTPLPAAGVGNSLPLISAPRLPLLLAALASLPVDHVVRSKHAGANLNFFKLEQAAVPAPAAYDRPADWAPHQSVGAWVLDRLAGAVAWSAGLEALAGELGRLGASVPLWREETAAQAGLRRRLALADLDAAHAVLLGLDREDFEHVLSTFSALRRRELAVDGGFGTARRALAAYDALVAGPPSSTCAPAVAPHTG